LLAGTRQLTGAKIGSIAMTMNNQEDLEIRIAFLEEGLNTVSGEYYQQQTGKTAHYGRAISAK
jgi:tetrahydromethanopterin S-methyltransferase subunit G